MAAVRGQYVDGHVVLSERADWPEGTQVVVAPVEETRAAELLEEQSASDPACIRAWIAEFDTIPPLELTEEEEAAWQAARRKQKEHELSRWHETVRDAEELMP